MLWDDLSGDAWAVAPRLLGSFLIRELDGQRLVGKIVETEAYDQTDVASHSYKGSNGRAAVTFASAGYLYVHAIRHYCCCDITTGKEGYGSSVLIRALEPVEGELAMQALRHTTSVINLTNGPGKLCQALAIGKQLNGHDLRTAPLRLMLQPAVPLDDIVQTTRIGITQAKDVPWRFYIKGSAYVSRIT